MLLQDKNPEQEQAVSEEDEIDTSAEEVAITSDLHVKTQNLSAESIVKRMSQGLFVIPSNQRPFVWTPVQQSKLIESMLMGLPLPTAYLHERADGTVAICDGQQRLTTVSRYFEGKFALKLGTDEDPAEYQLPNGETLDLNKKKFADLPPVFQRKLEDTQFPLYVIPSNTPPEILLEIFDRVNSGTPLTRQQLRQNMYDGPAIAFLKEGATYMEKTIKWTKANLRKSRDREIVNRWVAYTLAGYTHDCSYDALLCEGLALYEGLSAKQQENLAVKFKHSIDNAVTIFGEYAFRKYDMANLPKRRPPFNVALFDCVAVVLGKVSKTKVSKATSALREAFSDLLRDGAFDEAISNATNSPERVATRFLACEEWIKIA